MNLLRFLLPYTYFYGSRVKGLKYNLYYLIIDWFVPFVFLTYCLNLDWQQALLKFVLAYLAFISIYEIGYLGNDVYSVRTETNPRRRVKDFDPSDATVGIWVLVRVAAFVGISWYLDVLTNPLWLAFYGVLAVFFYLHNVLKEKELKVMTFVNLAFVRYFAPIFIFLTPEQLMLFAAPVFLNYVFYRTLMYIDSKGMLNMPSRRLPSYKVNYYLLAGGVSLLLSLMGHSWVPLAVTGYYLAFWLAVRMAGIEPPQAE
ncbi:hypothetical protein HER32_15585 [Hymenobacter sp. BT18]|uniref:hypothetical protein n=1 Tax=Hymenobacter sp. BT18 TaxID=2835648 RepID=UPI00143E70C3|nr:hypothetical protein [Hymenobacter sp. BT18]QIX62523.1 hypothetical protein HER32_15585 [Hymenobacter sp. BT18]